MFTHFRGGIVRNVTHPNGATKTRALNAHAQVRPSTLTTPTGNTWSINRLYYTPTIGGTTYTTNVMGSLIYENIGRTLSYTYDASGNISAITDTTGTISTEKTYQYDELNQLIRENDPVANKTTTYTYDVGGNILAKIEYPYTTGSLGTPTNTFVYTYGNTEWKDLLTEYNGNAITYDQIGNPLTYYNGTTFTWNYGRKLTSAVLANGTTISYKYNDSGIRTQKTVNGVTTDYFLDGTNIVAQKTGNNTMWFYYDGDGTREAIEYNGNVYYYFYNAQGDVIGLFDNNLNVVVEYSYDSWGNVISITGSLASTLGQDNPFRYRGYYYDSDTGLYYLNSRYYDSNTGRFINADSAIGQIGNIQGTNMFTYCFNSPVNMSDSTGNWPKLSSIFTVVAVAAVAVAAVAITVATCGAAAPALAVAGGGIIGGISAGTAAAAASVATGAMLVAGVSTAAAVTSAVAEKAADKTAKRNNSVYVLKDDTGTVQYVGRTTDVDKRTKAHESNPARAGLKLVVIQPNLNYAQARAVEQAAMAYYHTINTANKMNNQINGISPSNPNLSIYKEAAVGMLGYSWNQVSNEILYWTGN